MASAATALPALSRTQAPTAVTPCALSSKFVA